MVKSLKVAKAELSSLVALAASGEDIEGKTDRRRRDSGLLHNPTLELIRANGGISTTNYNYLRSSAIALAA